MIATSLKLYTAQTTWAVTLQEAKDQCNVDTSDSDTLIQDLIYVAQEQVEDYCSLKLNACTYEFYLTGLPNNGIVLPLNPVASITSIKYRDASNAEQTWATTNYYYSIQESPLKIRYTDAYSLPSLYTNRFDAITVRFVTGYTSPDTIPKKLKQAILILVNDLYDMRMNVPRQKFSNWEALCYSSRVWHSTVENRY